MKKKEEKKAVKKKIISQAEFARQCGVRPQAISKAAKAGLLKTTTKSKIILNDPFTKLYLEKQKIKPKNNQIKKTTKTQKKTTNSKKKETTQHKKNKPSSKTKSTRKTTSKKHNQKKDTSKTELFEDIEVNESASEEITDEDIDLVSLQRRKTFEEIGKIKADRKLKELKLAQERGELINKDRTAKVLFQYLDACNINLLTAPEMIIDSVIDKVKAGSKRGDILKLWRNLIQKEIRRSKKQIKQRLK